MDYKFPIIHIIDDVLPAIEDSKEFIVVEKDGYTVINYMVIGNDTFPPVNIIDLTNGDSTHKGIHETEQDYFAAVRRECRGIKFYPDGKIAQRPLHKFFNIGEKDETQENNIDWNQPHILTIKADGSMVIPLMVNGYLRWTTKMGITDTSMLAEEFIARNPKYTQAAHDCINAGLTPIFEYCSNKNRIVLDYPEEQLILLAIRENITGIYMSRQAIDTMNETWNIPLIGISSDKIHDISKLENTEGIVITFDNGHKCKIKSEWYVLRHKSKDAIMREKNVLDYIINEKVDDVIPFLTENDAKKLKEFNNKVNDVIIAYAYTLQFTFDFFWNKANKDKKTFAIKYADEFTVDKSLAFLLTKGLDAVTVIREHISKNLGTQKDVEGIRHMIGNLKWEY